MGLGVWRVEGGLWLLHPLAPMEDLVALMPHPGHPRRHPVDLTEHPVVLMRHPVDLMEDPVAQMSHQVALMEHPGHLMEHWVDPMEHRVARISHQHAQRLRGSRVRVERTRVGVCDGQGLRGGANRREERMCGLGRRVVVGAWPVVRGVAVVGPAHERGWEACVSV